MNPLTQELHDLAAALTATGLPATVDPGQVLGVVTSNGVCALVEPTNAYAPLTYGMDFDMVVPVWLITAAPYDQDAVERLDDALILAWPVTRPTQPVTRETYEPGDQSMPALLIQTPRHVTCLT